MLSLCMIVKNEEENLKKCLSLVNKFVDEIIIVDTGSKDNTKIVALEFTEKVYDFEWCNDFSAARNFSVSKATNDWVLVLDADEYIFEFSTKMITNFIRCEENREKVGRIQIINIIDENLIEKKSFERINRLFNVNYFYYLGIIHEQLKAKAGDDFITVNVDISVNHIGYSQLVINKTNKLDRNMKLLNLALLENDEDPYIYYQLGKTQYLMKNYKEASSNFEKALLYDLNYKLEYVANLIETYGYCLIKEERFCEAMNFEVFLKYYNNPDFYFIMGLIYMNNAKFTLAIDSFIKCTEFSYGKMEGITTYLPYYNIGIIYDVLGISQYALDFYIKCGNYEPALRRIKVIQ